MKISTIMATYNSTKFLGEQLESILRQSRAVDEVIIMDDCSSDGTVRMVSEFIKENSLRNWMISEHEVNKGFIQTFIDAMMIASGDVIILCDHDDVWLDNKVEVIEAAFKGRDDILALATSFEEIDSDGEPVPVKERKGRANNNLIRRKVIGGGYDENCLPGLCCI